jgi:hypothetical protein
VGHGVLCTFQFALRPCIGISVRLHRDDQILWVTVLQIRNGRLMAIVMSVCVQRCTKYVVNRKVVVTDFHGVMSRERSVVSFKTPQEIHYPADQLRPLWSVPDRSIIGGLAILRLCRRH